MWNEDNSQGFLLTIIKGVVLTALVTMICLLVFSLVIRLAYLEGSIVKWINQFLKIFSIFIGVFFSVKANGGILKGSLIGGLSTVVIFVIFAIISGQKVALISFFADILFGVIVGGIIGIMAVNRKA